MMNHISSFSDKSVYVLRKYTVRLFWHKKKTPVKAESSNPNYFWQKKANMYDKSHLKLNALFTSLVCHTWTAV